MSKDLYIENGDFVIKNRDFTTITGEKKLIQDVLKICLTPVGANVLQPWYGSFINQTLIGSELDSDTSLSVAENQLTSALENLQKLQNLQITSTNQKVTPEELIAAIRDVSISQNTNDPRAYEVSITVLTKMFSKVNVSFSVYGR